MELNSDLKKVLKKANRLYLQAEEIVAVGYSHDLTVLARDEALLAAWDAIELLLGVDDVVAYVENLT